MDSRPLVKIGPDSYGVTIPKQWIEEFKLVENSSLFLKNHTSFISIHLQNDKKDSKNAIISFDEISLKIFNKILISYYIRNYETIVIKGKSVNERIEHIKSYISKLPSLEIIEIHKEEIILHNPNSNHKSLKKLTSLMINSIHSMYELLIETNQEQYSNNHSKVKLLDFTLNQLYFSSIKLLNYKIEIEQDFVILKNVSYYIRIVNLLEKIGDILKRISKYEDSKRKLNYENEDEELPTQNPATNVIKIELFHALKMYHESFNCLDGNSKSIQNSLLNEIQDKKNSILKILEDYTYSPYQDPNQYQIQLVVSQLIKDLLGTYDEILIITIDLIIE